MAVSTSAFAEPTQSLAERRLSIIKRSSTGIVLIDLPSEQRPAAAAPAAATATATTNPSTPASTNSGVAGASPTTTGVVSATSTASSASPAKSVEAAAPQPAVLNRFFSTMPAPSGRSLQQARRLDAPDQGVPLPFARPAPVPAAELDTKR
ncbi:MAG: hypothetical protein CFE43_03965 [Burkholderiales bacterium PBB3]|nr:MAG: hypothetical protein CFE43_03965 [Burkholderiales bacterium PBB3]